jgi:hypothetical protein
MRRYISRMLRQSGCLLDKPFGHGYVQVTDDPNLVGRCVGCPKVIKYGGTYDTRWINYDSPKNLARVAARIPRTPTQVT